MQKVLATILTVLFVLYPFVVFFGLGVLPISVLSIILLVLFILRTVFVAKVKKSDITQLLPMLISVGSVFLLAALLQSERTLLFTPVMVNLVLLFNFLYSLKKKPTMIERFAILGGEERTESLSAYCQKVTIVWCLFFIVNGSIALYTVLSGDSKLWVLYNGFLSYMLIGSLMGIELIVRFIIRHKERTVS